MDRKCGIVLIFDLSLLHHNKKEFYKIFTQNSDPIRVNKSVNIEQNKMFTVSQQNSFKKDFL